MSKQDPIPGLIFGFTEAEAQSRFNAKFHEKFQEAKAKTPEAPELGMVMMVLFDSMISVMAENNVKITSDVLTFVRENRFE